MNSELQRLIEIVKYQRELKTHVGNPMVEEFTYQIGDILKNQHLISPEKYWVIVGLDPVEGKIWVKDIFSDGTMGDTCGFLRVGNSHKIVGNVIEFHERIDRIKELEREIERLKQSPIGGGN